MCNWDYNANVSWIPRHWCICRKCVSSAGMRLQEESVIYVLIRFHYEAIVEILGYCPVPVVCGLNWLGKTKSARAALSLIGNTGSFYSSAKDRFIPRLCARTTLPPVLDDVKKSKQIEDIAVAFYNRGKDGTCFLESTLRTCPIVTVNWEALDALNKDPRYMLIALNCFRPCTL